MPKFRKRPVEIEAHQWLENGDHPDDGPAHSEGKVVRYFRRPEPEYAGSKVHNTCGYTWHRHGWIDTLEGGHTVCPGDWIITGVQGELYPCKPDIFAKTYEPTDGPAAEQGAPVDWQAIVRQHESELKAEGECRHQAEQERDQAYRERAHLVAYLAALHTSHIGRTDPTAPDWPVVIVETPAGQMSWHIAEGDLGLFEHVRPTCGVDRGWDGHTTDEKYARLRALTTATVPFLHPGGCEEHPGAPVIGGMCGLCTIHA